jgi:hypothetical protein
MNEDSRRVRHHAHETSALASPAEDGVILDAIPLSAMIRSSPEMREQGNFLVGPENNSVETLAGDFLATELEAAVSLLRGPHLRKYIYRQPTLAPPLYRSAKAFKPSVREN